MKHVLHDLNTNAVIRSKKDVMGAEGVGSSRMTEKLFTGTLNVNTNKQDKIHHGDMNLPYTNTNVSMTSHNVKNNYTGCQSVKTNVGRFAGQIS